MSDVATKVLRLGRALGLVGGLVHGQRPSSTAVVTVGGVHVTVVVGDDLALTLAGLQVIAA